jgi:hypothetical protein
MGENFDPDKRIEEFINGVEEGTWEMGSIMRNTKCNMCKIM